MKIDNLKKLITTNSNEEGVIDFDAIANSINEHTNTIRDNYAEKKASELKTQVSQESISEFLKGQGFENQDQFNAFVKNTKDNESEVSAKATRLEKELEDFNKKYSELENDYNSKKTELTNIKVDATVKELGIDDKFLDYAKFKANSLTSEEKDFGTALKEVVELEPHLAGKEAGFKFGVEPKGDNKPAPSSKNYERFLELKKQNKI